MPNITLMLNREHPTYAAMGGTEFNRSIRAFGLNFEQVPVLPLRTDRQTRTPGSGHGCLHVTATPTQIRRENINAVTGRSAPMMELIQAVNDELVLAYVGGVRITGSDLLFPDLCETVQQIAGVNTTTAAPAGASAGVDVYQASRVNFHVQCTAGDPSFKVRPWVLIGSVWTVIEPSEVTVTVPAYVIQPTSEQDSGAGVALSVGATRAYLQATNYTSGTWTLSVQRVR